MHPTLDEARTAVRNRPNAVRFKRASDNGSHAYYTCVSHEEEGCTCRLRLSQTPLECTKPGVWLLERANGHVCDALVLKDEVRKVKLRDTSHIKDAFGNPATGVHASKYCREGRQRGVHPALQAQVLQMNKDGTGPAAIHNALMAMLEKGDLDSVKSAADLPSVKQITVRLLSRAPC